MALRPRSFPIAAGPVAVGVAFAGLHAPHLDWRIAALALMASVLMQAITNLQNDLGFTQRGGERDGKRVGLPRASALGLLTSRELRVALVTLSLLGVVIGLALTQMRGWPVLVVGVLSLLAAIAYMGGPRPIAYTPWGEFTVFLFFGLVAVGGTYWLLTGVVDATALLAGAGSGALSATALIVNNQRDRDHDASIGRHTFAVVFGPQAAIHLYSLCIGVAPATSVWLAVAAQSPWIALPWLLAPRLWKLRRDFVQSPPGLALNAILMRTFAMVQWWSLLQATGALLAWPT